MIIKELILLPKKVFPEYNHNLILLEKVNFLLKFWSYFNMTFKIIK